MRTNIDLNDDLLREAGRYAHARSKRGIVEEALRTFVEYREAQERSATYAQRVQALRARTAGLTLRESPSAILRADRDTRR